MLRRVLTATLLSFSLSFVCVTTASAVVTSTTRSRTVPTPAGATAFTFTFPVLSTAHVQVTRTTVADGTELVLTNGGSCAACYNVTLSGGGARGGTVTTVTAVTNAYTLLIERVTPVTQPTSYTTQGQFRPASHEQGFDRLTMVVQEALAGVLTAGDADAAVATHSAASDPHTGYAKLLGRAGGQVLAGADATGGNLWLKSVVSGVPGQVKVGSTGTEICLDDSTNRVGIGTCGPSTTLEVNGSVKATGYTGTTLTDSLGQLEISGGASPGDVLYLYGDGASTGSIHLGSTAGATMLFLDETLGFVGIGDVTPTYALDVNGTGRFVGALSANASLTTPVIYGTGGSLFVYGGSGGGDDITIMPTLDAVTRGTLFFGNTGLHVYDDVNRRWGLGVAAPVHTLDVRGAINGLAVTQAAGAAYNVLISDCGGVTYTATDNGAVGLPAYSSSWLGCEITIINTAAAGAAKVILDASLNVHGIYGTCGATTWTGSATINNVKASAKRGDWLKVVLLDDGVLHPWYVTGCGGTWN